MCMCACVCVFFSFNCFFCFVIVLCFAGASRGVLGLAGDAGDPEVQHPQGVWRQPPPAGCAHMVRLVFASILVVAVTRGGEGRCTQHHVS